MKSDLLLTGDNFPVSTSPSHLLDSSVTLIESQEGVCLNKVVEVGSATTEVNTLTELGQVLLKDERIGVPRVLEADASSITMSFHGFTSVDSFRAIPGGQRAAAKKVRESIDGLYRHGLIGPSIVPRNIMLDRGRIVLVDWERGLWSDQKDWSDAARLQRAIELIEELSWLANSPILSFWSRRWPRFSALVCGKSLAARLTNFHRDEVSDERFPALAELLFDRPVEEISDALYARLLLVHWMAADTHDTCLSPVYALDRLFQADGSQRVRAAATVLLAHARLVHNSSVRLRMELVLVESAMRFHAETRHADSAAVSRQLRSQLIPRLLEIGGTEHLSTAVRDVRGLVEAGFDAVWPALKPVALLEVP